MTVRMRHTRAHTKNRRSHHAIETNPLAVCEKCNAPKVNHRICTTCGTYKGKVVLDKASKLEAKVKKTQGKGETK